jgi:predicted secreted protein
VLATGWDEEDLKHLLGGVIDAYTPILAPEFGAAQINDSDLKKAEGVFAVAQTIGAKIAVTCPHCGEDFEIDPQS